MACRMVLRSVFLMEPCLSFRPDRELPVKHYRTVRGRDFHLAARRAHRLSCSYKEGPSTSYGDDHDQGPPQEAVLKAISEVSKTEGRVGQTTNVVIGGTVADDSTNEWLALDQKVNSYPTVRGFTAIGTGGEDFVQAMVVAVESVIQQPIPEVNLLLAAVNLMLGTYLFYAPMPFGFTSAMIIPTWSYELGE
ncbi:hypothetical protein HS088_TW10G00163 [Tripterygium wilfordii]|uniref:Uncharacterized protein n=1 Tax=Tripterygium wilfordii TaxID=458696 RepID=A0A7J7D4H0_TRIWF|nr:hypothetical protein HS088_TW10G00163 [Tripterygium wilfordii]